MSDSPRLVQLNVRLPITDRDALRRLADASGISMTALLGAIVHSFLGDHDDEVPEEILTHARGIDSHRRLRPHLGRFRRHKE